MNENLKNLSKSLFDIGSLVFSVVAGRAAIYELFIEVPNVSFPRVQIDYTQDWLPPRVIFYLDTPTISWFIVLMGVFICCYYSCMLLWTVLKKNHQANQRKRYKTGQLIGLSIIFIAFSIISNNFFSSAGNFS